MIDCNSFILCQISCSVFSHTPGVNMLETLKATNDRLVSLIGQARVLAEAGEVKESLPEKL